MRLPPVKHIDAPEGLNVGILDWSGAPFHELRLVLPLPRQSDAHAAAAHVLGRSMLLAGGATSRQAADDAFVRRGAQASCLPGVDRVNVSLTAPPQEFGRLAQELLDRLRAPMFEPDAIATVVAHEEQVAQSLLGSRELALHELGSGRRWGCGHPYSRGVVPPAQMRRVTVCDVEDAAAELGLQDAAVMLVGDLGGRSGQAALSALQDALAAPWDSRQLPVPADEGVHQPGAARVPVGPTEPTGSVRVFGAAPVRHHPDHTALHVAAVVLGGYFGSRLVRELRERHGAVYGVAAGFEVLHRAATMVVSMECPADRVDQVNEETQRLLTELRENGPSEQELADAVRFSSRAATVGLGTPAALASAASTVLFAGSGLDMWQQQNDQSAGLNPADIADVLQRYARQDDLLRLVAAPG